jgi:hypothetical protein
MDRTFMITSHAILIATLGVVIPSIGIATILSDPLIPPATFADRVAAIVGMVLLAAFAVFRMATARVRVLADGVRVHNYLRNRFIRWEDIAEFSLRPWGLWFTPIGHVDLNDGSSFPVTGNWSIEPRNLEEARACGRHDRRAQPHLDRAAK